MFESATVAIITQPVCSKWRLEGRNDSKRGVLIKTSKGSIGRWCKGLHNIPPPFPKLSASHFIFVLYILLSERNWMAGREREGKWECASFGRNCSFFAYCSNIH